jgi:hypothetical protein
MSYILTLPKELQRLILFDLDYEQIIILCQDNSLSYILDDLTFWYDKAKKFGVNKGKFCAPKLRACDKYLYVKIQADISDTLTHLRYSGYLGVDCNDVIGVSSILTVAIKNNYSTIKSYLFDHYTKYHLHELLYGLIAGGDTDTALTLINSGKINFDSVGGNTMNFLLLATRKGKISILDAIFYQHERVVKSNIYLELLLVAIRYDQIEIVNYVLPKMEWNIENFKKAILESIRSQHIDILLLILTSIAKIANEFIMQLHIGYFTDLCLSYHNYDALVYFLNNYEFDLNDIMCEVGEMHTNVGELICDFDVQVIKLLIDRGATNLDEAVCSIIQIYPLEPIVLETVKFLISKGAKLTDDIIHILSAIHELDLDEKKDDPEFELHDYVKIYKELFQQYQR